MKRKQGNKARKIPVSTWIGIAVGVLGLLVGIVSLFLYFSSRAERELVYAVNPVRTAVVTAGQATELAVLYKDEPLGSVDITAAQVAIWNAGKQGIRKENVLEDVVISTDPPVPILEASIRQCSREVTGFTLVETPELLASGRVPVSWHILEENDGASIQLIYVGKQEVIFHVEGVIEGLRGIKDVELGVDIKTPQEQVHEQQVSRWFPGITALFLLLAAVSTFVYALIRRHLSPYLLVVAVYSLVAFGVMAWLYFSISARLWPPFGF
jgi:hypothetical protein